MTATTTTDLTPTLDATTLGVAAAATSTFNPSSSSPSTSSTSTSGMPTAETRTGSNAADSTVAVASQATTAHDRARVAAEAARRERRGVDIALGSLVLGLVISLGAFASVAWHDSVAANGPHGGPAYAARQSAQTLAP